MSNFTLNKVFLAGNLVKDPDIKETKSGHKFCILRLAVNERYQDKDSEETKEKKNYFNISVWGKGVEFAEKYLRAGKNIFVEAKMRYRTYEDKEEKTRIVTDIVAIPGGIRFI